MTAKTESLKQTFSRYALIVFGYLPLPLLHAVGCLLGLLLILIPNPLKKVSWAHMRYCLPHYTPWQQRIIVWKSLLHSMMAVMEWPAFWFGNASRLSRWVRAPQAAQQLHILQSQGKGVILLCPHWGAWELAGLFVSAHAPITSLYKPQKGVIDALILEGRSRLGASLAPTSANGVKQVFAALKKSEIAGILPDHDPPDNTGVFVPFFGQPAHTMDLVTKLAHKTNAPVWFCIAERKPFVGFVIHLLAAPSLIADPQQGVQAMNTAIETLILKWPQQYWWGYKRYRRRPENSPNPYG